MYNHATTGVTWADLGSMSVDECEVQNRYLDALLEAKFLDEEQARKRKG